MTKSSEYALRAMIYLVQRKDRWPIPGREIAKGVSIPAKYLQKILGDLTRSGVLESSPGRTGGFRLRRPGNRIPLLDILTPFERFQPRRCPFGNAVCDDRNPCRAHPEWKKVVEAEQQFLRGMTIDDVAEPIEESRRGRGRKSTAGSKTPAP
jgi:Rrf2 family protein